MKSKTGNRVKSFARTMLVGVIAGVRYYVAMHNDLARWIWKRLRIEKQEASE